jgi:hypothetical protein
MAADFQSDVHGRRSQTAATVRSTLNKYAVIDRRYSLSIFHQAKNAPMKRESLTRKKVHGDSAFWSRQDVTRSAAQGSNQN